MRIIPCSVTHSIGLRSGSQPSQHVPPSPYPPTGDAGRGNSRGAGGVVEGLDEGQVDAGGLVRSVCVLPL